MTDAAIECSQLIKRYGDKTVLTDINLTVNQGEYFGLIGINGCGKSTMIKSILDLISIDSGEINLFGVHNRLVESRNNIAYLPDRFLPPTHLTGTDFIQYMLSLHGSECEDDEIESMLTALELDSQTMKASVSKLSKGMTQKLGLACCM